MGVRGVRFRSRFAKGTSVLIDTAPLIYHLEDVEPWSALTTMAFDLIASEQVSGFISAVSVAELLVKPFAAGAQTAESAERFLLSIPNVAIAPVDYAISRRAADLRARYRARTPDALIIATALILGIDRILTNDVRLEAYESEGVEILLLSRFVV